MAVLIAGSEPVRNRSKMTMSHFLRKEDMYEARWNEAEKELVYTKAELETLKEDLAKSTRGRAFLRETHRVDLDKFQQSMKLHEDLQGRLALLFVDKEKTRRLEGTPEGYLLKLLKQYLDTDPFEVSSRGVEEVSNG